MFAFYPKKAQKPEEPSASQLNLLLQDNKEYFDKSTNTDKEYADKSTNTDRPDPDYRSLFERIRKQSGMISIFYENLPSFVFLLALAIITRN